MANRTVHIAIDLGSDTVKVAYAYRDGNDYTGKLVDDPQGMTAIPSVAFYDPDEKKWLFGAELDFVGEKPFLTVVKICDLLRLLQTADNAAVHKSNVDYYRKKNRFPKFYFPLREVLTDNMAHTENRGQTFDADTTPERVCERFFDYIHGVVRNRVNELFGDDKTTIKPCLVYPPFSESEYTAELKRLVRRAFGTEPNVVMSMAKALCAYAKCSGRLGQNDKTIIFNIGEERISLVKVTFANGGVSVDGADGHNAPMNIGGKDIDDAVAHYIERQIAGRETMGRPSSGEVGHFAESALNTKQFLFVKNIKTAKIVLGMPIYESKAFADGVPVSAAHDLVVQRRITREQFCECLGIPGDGGIARRFADYMITELRRPINSDVRRVFITGGPVETYGLVPYIRKKLGELDKDVYTFEKDDADYVGMQNDGYNILGHEDALYAPALGCAMASLSGITIDMVLALTYGVRIFHGNNTSQIPFFQPLVGKGTRIPQRGETYYTPKPGESGIGTGNDSSESAVLHIFSTFFSPDDIAHARRENVIVYHKTDKGKLLVMDTENRVAMRKLENEMGLCVLNGSMDRLDVGAIARYYHNDRPVRLETGVSLQFGVEIDCDGYAKTTVRNDIGRNGTAVTRIRYLDGAGQAQGLVVVPKSEIELRLNIETQLT